MVIKPFCFQTKHSLSLEDCDIWEERYCMCLLWIFPVISPAKYLTAAKSKWTPNETETSAGNFKGQSSRKPMTSPLEKRVWTRCWSGPLVPDPKQMPRRAAEVSAERAACNSARMHDGAGSCPAVSQHQALELSRCPLTLRLKTVLGEKAPHLQLLNSEHKGRKAFHPRSRGW